jgi:hypothetical protein
MRAVGMSLIVLLLAGCAATGVKHQRLQSFDESEYAPYSQKGTAVIEGQAFMRTAGGDVKYAAGSIVAMNPVTTYSREWWDTAVVKGQNMAEADSRANDYHWSTTADGEGRFSFENLPAGEYYIACGVSWKVSSYRTSGGAIGAQVKVSDGEHVRVILQPVRTF